MRKIQHLAVGALLVAGYFAGLPGHLWSPAPPFAVPETAESAPAPGQSWRLASASNLETRLVHAASMVELPDGRVRAFWFAGSREGAADVGIHSAVFDPAGGEWSPERRVIHRKQVEQALGRNIRKLGNAVPVRDGERLRLYFVAVSVGGWSGSRLAVAESTDHGETWRVTGELVTSPFFNLSTLVKGPPIRFADGSLGLPVYHEFLGKFGELLRITPEQRLVEKQRISHHREALQPVVLVEGQTEATALLRNASETRPGILFESRTADRGRHWSPLGAAGLPNPGSAVGAVSLGPQRWLVSANDNRFERDTLAVLDSPDAGQSWRRLATLHDRAAFREAPVPRQRFRTLVAEDLSRFHGVAQPQAVVDAVLANKCRSEGCEFQFDYPYVLRTGNGDIHVLYTWNKTLVGHAWWQAGEGQP